MKDAILGALTMAAKHDAKMGNNLNQRVIGEKEDVVTQGDIEIFFYQQKIELLLKVKNMENKQTYFQVKKKDIMLQ